MQPLPRLELRHSPRTRRRCGGCRGRHLLGTRKARRCRFERYCPWLPDFDYQPQFPLPEWNHGGWSARPTEERDQEHWEQCLQQDLLLQGAKDAAVLAYLLNDDAYRVLMIGVDLIPGSRKNSTIQAYSDNVVHRLLSRIIYDTHIFCSLLFTLS